MKIDTLNDLSRLYFQCPSRREIDPCIRSDAFEIKWITEQRGRGMVATKDLPGGTCLFVIPPTVSTPFMEVLKEWKKKGGKMDPNHFEQAAENVLLHEMKNAIAMSQEEKGNSAVADSFLVLEGSRLRREVPSVDCLLAQEKRKAPSVSDFPNVSEDDLRQIIRRNAFGPDFVSYSTILRDLPKRPHRVLGLYPLADMMNHSCQPNSVRVFVREHMVIHTAKPVKKGEEITGSYVPPTFSFPQRQSSLKENHNFVCSCERCTIEKPFWQKASEKVIRLAEMQATSTISDSIEMTMYLEENLFQKFNSAELQRYVRLGFTPSYMASINEALLTGSLSDHFILRLCLQLHFCFVCANPSSTEHLSILHLGYDLISKMHTEEGIDQSQTLPKVKFWTEQLKQACLIRYGQVGDHLESIRQIMKHTRLVLRTPNGMQHTSYPFI